MNAAPFIADRTVELYNDWCRAKNEGRVTACCKLDVIFSAVATSLLRPLASADQSYSECEKQNGQCWRQYTKGLRTKLVEIACGCEHISKTWFRFLQPDAKV